MRLLYKVADLTFELIVPNDFVPSRYLPSFAPFSQTFGSSISDVIFSLKDSTIVPDLHDGTLVETFSNDLGDVCVYRLEREFAITYSYSDKVVHCLVVNESFTSGFFCIDWNSKYASIALTSMVRTVFAQSVLSHDGISIHSSVVSKGGYGFLFLGKSGTGKSTHTRLWLKNFSDSSLLNDDNPIVRFIDGVLYVYGSPWSGKTDCYINDRVKVASFVRLEQAPLNLFYQLEGVKAWTELFPSCSVLRECELLNKQFVTILNRIVDHTIVAHLKCLPDDQAALISEMSIRHLLENNS